MRDYNGILNISEPDNDYSVYIMYSSDKTDNSIYVGVTLDYKQRSYKHSIDRKNKKAYSHKPLYKWLSEVIDVQERKVIFEVIEKGYSETEAFNREVELIKGYRDKGYNVLNISNGGKGHTGNIPWNKGKKMPETIVQKFRDSHKGHKSPMEGKTHTEESKKLITLRNKQRKDRGWVNPRKKRVYKYDLNGVLVTEYSCLQEAGKMENSNPTSIGEWCRGIKKPKNRNFKWSYIKLTK